MILMKKLHNGVRMNLISILMTEELLLSLCLKRENGTEGEKLTECSLISSGTKLRMRTNLKEMEEAIMVITERREDTMAKTTMEDTKIMEIISVMVRIIKTTTKANWVSAQF